MCNWKKWIWPGIIATALLALAAVFFKAGPVEQELTGRASQALSAQHGWANVNLDGRDLTLTGTAPSEAAKAEALMLADQAYDVRVVADQTDLLAVASPYPFKADKQGNTITLTGNVPDDAARAALIGATQAANPGAEVVDELTLARGASAAFPALTAFGVAKLADLSSGVASLSDDNFSITGVAATSPAFESVTASLTGDLPEGGTLTLADITPPAAEGDYRFSALLQDPSNAVLEGFVPSVDMRNALEASAKSALPNVTIANNLTLATGAPEDYEGGANFAIEQLKRFTSGSAVVTNKGLSISGVAATSEDFTAARAAIAGALPAGLSLASSAIVPPLVEGDYSLSAAKTDNALRLSGLAPSTESRDAIAAAAASANPGLEIINDVQIAAGVPASIEWDNAAAFGFSQMPKLSSGTMTLNGTELSINGQAIDGESYVAVNALSKAALPAGIEKANIGVVLPAVEPFTWSATKDATGVTLTGFVPSSEIKAANVEAAKALTNEGAVIDQQELAQGAPAGFADAVTFSLDQLKMLDSGKADYSAGTLAITGTAPDLATKLALEGALATAPDGTSVSGSIASPRIEPYIWSATKSDKSVFLTGYVPTMAMKDANVEAAKALTTSGAVIDQQQLAEGAPTGFGSAVQYGLAALKDLETGSATYNAGALDITGYAPDYATKLALDERLVPKAPGFTTVTAAITSPEPPAPELPPLPTPPAPPEPPVVVAPVEPEPVEPAEPELAVASPYIWSATKSAEGVLLEGHVPSEDGRIFAVNEATKLANGGRVTDNMTLASGVPAGFGSAVRYGLEALAPLEMGKAAYADKTLQITGNAASFDLKTQLEADLPANAPNFTSVIAAITSPPKPAPVAVDPCVALIASAQGARYLPFDTNKADIKGDTSELDSIISVAQRCENAKIVVIGHTDSRGPDAYNEDLSQRRAASVRDYMVQNGGIAIKRITAFGMGEAQPIATNDTEEGMATNRRIEFRLTR